MLEPRPEFIASLRELKNCPDDLFEEILTIDERARDLEELYQLHTTREPDRHRVDLRVYVNGRPTGTGTLVISADQHAKKLLTQSAVEETVRELQPELDELYQTWCAQIRAKLITDFNKGAQTDGRQETPS